MARKKIYAYPMNDSVRSRIDHGHYYAIQSQADASMIYVLEKDEVAILTRDVAIRIPNELFGEIADLAADLKDLKRRRIV